MKVLITGGNGFLGARLARRLADDGHQVRAIVRKLEGNEGLAHPNIELVKGDFADVSVLQGAMQGIQGVYHLAAISTDWATDLRDFYKVNVEGSMRIVEAARAAGVGRIVITSSAGSIGPPDPDHIYPVTEDHVRHMHFFNDYECTKIMLEERMQRYVREGMDIVIVNPTKIYGPWPIERKNAYLLLIHSYLYKTFAPYPAFKTQISNFVYIDDVVEGHLLAMEKGRSGERYLLGGSDVTFPELFALLQRITGHKGRPIAIPIGLFKTFASLHRLRAKWFGKAPMVTHNWIDKSSYSWPVSSEKAKKELGYAPMDYETAIRKTVDFLEQKLGKVKGSGH